MNKLGKVILRFISLLIFLTIPALIYCQSTNVHISNQRIYDFLDELASEKLFSLNSTIKPYTREYIYSKLSEAFIRKDLLNNRQQKELEYYLDYYRFGSKPNYLPIRSKVNLFKKSKNASTSLNHLAFFYSDSLFNFSLRPIQGFDYLSNSSGDYTHTWKNRTYRPPLIGFERPCFTGCKRPPLS